MRKEKNREKQIHLVSQTEKAECDKRKVISKTERKRQTKEADIRNSTLRGIKWTTESINQKREDDDVA